MIKKAIAINIVIAVMCIFSWGAQPAVTTITADRLQELLTDHTGTFDFILLDVRDDSEVKEGIIASAYCKPYHMSWNSNVLSQKYTLLPKDVQIVIYCKSGNRSGQAANFLAGKGYTLISSLAQGINSYIGTLADSTEFQPLSSLPQPSYSGNITASVKQFSMKQRAVIVTAPSSITKRVDLQGRELRPSSGQRNAPVYILERIGEQPTGSVSGIRRLLHER